MNPLLLTIILSTIIAIAVILMGRWFYLRTLRMRQQEQMSAMFTNITHEILTPLTILSSSIELLRQDTPEHKNAYDMMDLNVQRIVRLLQQILETSKSQSGELKLLVSNGDVMTYIRQTALCVKPLMMKNGQSLYIHCSPETMMGWIDPDKLDKIIFNLLSNAAKYSGDNGEIQLNVRTNHTYDHITIEVKDNGCGIPKERQKHLFERFYDGEYRRFNTSGNGLGLALTRDLALLHHGSISCESEEGKGATFTVVLPISKDHFEPSQIDEKNQIQLSIPQSNILDIHAIDAEEVVASELNQKADEEAYKLLLVEDNKQLLMLMRRLLKQNYHVFVASNGREALDIIGQQELDLIVSDVMMPVMDGNELTRSIKESEEYGHLPIILLTAKTQEEDREESLVIGADDYITKPFKIGDLKLRINNIIENRKRIQREFSQQTIEETKNKTAETDTPDNEFLKAAINCVYSHMADSDYDRDRFAADMLMSASSLYNKLRSITGMSVSSFIRDIRMKEARRILTSTPNARVSDVAYQVGFKDPKYFATIFKKEFGIQPSEFSKSLDSSSDKPLK